MILDNAFAISELATTFAAHIHETNVPLGPTSPPAAFGALATARTGVHLGKMLGRGSTLTFNMTIQKINYLMPLFSTYINSRHVNTT